MITVNKLLINFPDIMWTEFVNGNSNRVVTGTLGDHYISFECPVEATFKGITKSQIKSLVTVLREKQ